jgi:hypothetical protein
MLLVLLCPLCLWGMMLVAFVLSVLMWTFFVGRLVAFGPNVQIVLWSPVVHSSTWYRMTPMKVPMPYWFIVLVPFLFMVSQIQMLNGKNAHACVLSVVSLMSWQAFVPIFVVHVHSESLIAVWALCNLVLAAVALVFSLLAIVPVVIFLWFVWMEVQVMYVGIVREHPGGMREPRVV